MTGIKGYIWNNYDKRLNTELNDCLDRIVQIVIVVNVQPFLILKKVVAKCQSRLKKTRLWVS